MSLRTGLNGARGPRGRMVRSGRRSLPSPRGAVVRVVGLAPRPSALVRAVRATSRTAALGLGRLAPRERALRLERRTYALGAVSLASAGIVLGGELLRIARRSDGAGAGDGPSAARATARQTVAVAVTGFRSSPRHETALLNLLLSFVLTSVAARGSSYAIRRRGRFGPFRNLVVGRRHVHHFVPGIVLACVAGGAAVVSRRGGPHALLAVPFGMGLALTLDESALLLVLDDVYWTREGVLSIQITLSTVGLLSMLILGRRVLRRGEQRGPADPLAAPSVPGPPASTPPRAP